MQSLERQAVRMGQAASGWTSWRVRVRAIWKLPVHGAVRDTRGRLGRRVRFSAPDPCPATTLAPPIQEIHPGAFISERALHPPDFHLDHTLQDWPECWLEVACPCSPRVTLLPMRLLTERHGNRPFRAVLDALRFKDCRGKPAPVHLIAGHSRTFTGGPRPSWALELVPPPR